MSLVYQTNRRSYGYNLAVHRLSGDRLQVHVDLLKGGHGVVLQPDEARDFIAAIAALQEGGADDLTRET